MNEVLTADPQSESEELLSLIYVSTAASGLGPQDLADMLKKSAPLNQRDGVHGTLLMSNGHFMHCLEGERSGVERSLARIKASRLHHRMIELVRSPVSRRRFSGSNWAYKLGAQREFSDPATAQMLEAPGHDQPVSWGRRTIEQRILREFWDTPGDYHRIW